MADYLVLVAFPLVVGQEGSTEDLHQLEDGSVGKVLRDVNLGCLTFVAILVGI